MPYNHAPTDNDIQPFPSSYAITSATLLQIQLGADPRFGCWFCGDPCVAIAPRESSGNDSVPAHWLPVCGHHCEHWHDETDAAERMPIIPRDGVRLSREQAEVVERVMSHGILMGEAALDALAAIRVGLRALMDRPESEDDPDGLAAERGTRPHHDNEGNILP